MSGAITELVAQGVQDTFLTGTPTMSFFKQVFKQHTNFSQEKIRQVFKAQPVSGGMSSVIIKRSGDLIGDMYLIKDDSDTAALTNTMAAMVDKFELYIGGQKIDEYTGSATGTLGTAGVVAKANALGLSGRDMTPLYFFNCNDFSSYIPLVALQYHDVEIRIHWSSLVEPSKNITLYTNNIYLDTKERSALTQGPINMLITQHQYLTFSDDAKMIDIPFSHPIKALFLNQEGISSATTTQVAVPVVSNDFKMTLEFNGQQRFEPQGSRFFRFVEGYYHCSPKSTSDLLITPPWVYSFALNYGQRQPSGTCNFSRLDSARLHVTSGNFAAGQVLELNAINYNVLRFENGLGSLMFAN